MDRLIDSEPVERNYLLLHFLRSVGIGRGRGANFDAIEYSMEESLCRSFSIQELFGNVNVFLYKFKPFSKWKAEEKLNAIYSQCCLNYHFFDKPPTNEDLRTRFGLKEKDKSVVSHLLKTAIDKGLIKPPFHLRPLKPVPIYLIGDKNLKIPIKIRIFL